ncbi:hypothetical protein ACFL1E_06635 [Candidatus Omnitrophota bacterium]
MIKKSIFLAIMGALLCSMSGCGGQQRFRGDYPFKESNWIREGKPLIFEDQRWYPTDNVENLLDQEMEYMGEYEGIPFYVEKRDVRPFQMLFTKFGYHKFRVFLKEEGND